MFKLYYMFITKQIFQGDIGLHEYRVRVRKVMCFRSLVSGRLLSIMVLCNTYNAVTVCIHLMREEEVPCCASCYCTHTPGVSQPLSPFWVTTSFELYAWL